VSRVISDNTQPPTVLTDTGRKNSWTAYLKTQCLLPFIVGDVAVKCANLLGVVAVIVVELVVNVPASNVVIYSKYYKLKIYN